MSPKPKAFLADCSAIFRRFWRRCFGELEGSLSYKLSGIITPECPRSAQPKVSLECPTPESRAQPHSVPGVPNPRVSLPREGGDVRSKIVYLHICNSM